MIVSKEIKMSSGKMLSQLYLRDGISWSIVALSGVIVFIILGLTLDYRFYFLSLIWLFLFIPLIIAFLYFFYGMKPLTAFNCIPHQLNFDDQNLKIKIYHRETDQEEKEFPPTYYTIDYNEFTNLNSGPDYLILVSRKKGWIYLPYKSFDSLIELQEIIKKFDFSSKTKI